MQIQMALDDTPVYNEFGRNQFGRTREEEANVEEQIALERTRQWRVLYTYKIHRRLTGTWSRYAVSIRSRRETKFPDATDWQWGSSSTLVDGSVFTLTKRGGVRKAKKLINQYINNNSKVAEGTVIDD